MDKMRSLGRDRAALIFILAGTIMPAGYALAETSPLTIVPTAGTTAAEPARAHFDFGTIHELDGLALDHVFTVKNSSAAPVLFNRLITSCSCTGAMVQGGVGRAIPPGGQISIRVTLDLNDLPFGPVEKEASVYVVGSALPAARLEMAGTLLPAAQFTPSVLNFAQVAAGSGRRLSLIAIADRRLAPSGTLPPLLSSNPDIRVMPVGPPGTAGGEIQQQYIVALAPEAPLGPIRGSLSFGPASAAGAGRRTRAEALLAGQVKGDLTAEPSLLSFGAVEAGENARQSVALVAAKPGLFENLKASSSSEWVQASLLPANAGGLSTRFLQVTLLPGTPVSRLKAEITLSLPNGQRLVLPVSAYVNPPRRPRPDNAEQPAALSGAPPTPATLTFSGGGNGAVAAAPMSGQTLAATTLSMQRLLAGRPPANIAVRALTQFLQRSRGPEWDDLKLLAIGGLARYGPAAAEAATPLAQLLADSHENDDVRGAAAEALSATTADTAPLADLLNHALQDGTADSNLLLRLMPVVGGLGARAHSIEPALLKLLQHKDERVQYGAYLALGRVHEENSLSTAAAIQRLQAMETSTPGESSAAFLALNDAGSSASSAAPVLVSILQQPTKTYYHLAAIRSLEQVSLTATPATTEALLNTVAGTDGAASAAAEHALGRLVSGDGDVVSSLARYLEYPEERVRFGAARALSQLQGSGLPPGVAPGTIHALEGIDGKTPASHVRSYIELLGRLQTSPPGAAPVLLKKLLLGSPMLVNGSDGQSSQAYLLAGLVLTGVHTTDLPAILEGLRSNDPHVFAAAARAAAGLGPAAKATVPLLLRGLEPSMPNLPLDGLFGPYDADSDKPFTSARVQAMGALARIGPRAAAAIPLLREVAQRGGSDPLSKEDGVLATQLLEKLGDLSHAPLPEESLAVAVTGQVRMNRPVPSFGFTDLRGGAQNFTNFAGQLPLFVFVSATCHTVTANRDRIAALQQKYGAEGLRVIFVFADLSDSESVVRKFVATQKMDWLITRDNKQELMRLFNARVNSETFLFDRAGVLRYHGRIDDSLFDPTAVTEHTLENAIREVLANKPVTEPESRAVGCALPQR